MHLIDRHAIDQMKPGDGVTIFTPDDTVRCPLCCVGVEGKLTSSPTLLAAHGDRHLRHRAWLACVGNKASCEDGEGSSGAN